MTLDDDYATRVLNHYKAQPKVLFKLMMIVQDLCPGGEWVFQFLAYPEMQENNRIANMFIATVTNGDDNVTCKDESPTGAVAGLLYRMLSGQGNPFPLTGNGGRKFFPADNGWVRASQE